MFDFSTVSAMLFDCDGTLIDSLAAWDEAERALFAQAGVVTREVENELHAAPIDEAASMFHELLGVFDSAEAVLAHLDGALLPFYGERACAMPGAVEFVRATHRAGVPCVVVSSSPRRYLVAGLARVGILDCFDALFPTDELRLSKTDPEIYRTIAKLVGCTPESTWLVDDAPYALEAARAAGMHTIGAAAGSSEARAREMERVSDVVCENLAEMLSNVKEPEAEMQSGYGSYREESDIPTR